MVMAYFRDKKAVPIERRFHFPGRCAMLFHSIGRYPPGLRMIFARPYVWLSHFTHSARSLS